MASFTLNTRTYGREDFFVADGPHGGYVRRVVYRNGAAHDDQPCQGGGFRGPTLLASAATLEAEVRRWHAGRMRGRRAAGLRPGDRL